MKYTEKSSLITTQDFESAEPETGICINLCKRLSAVAVAESPSANIPVEDSTSTVASFGPPDQYLEDFKEQQCEGVLRQ